MHCLSKVKPEYLIQILYELSHLDKNSLYAGPKKMKNESGRVENWSRGGVPQKKVPFEGVSLSTSTLPGVDVLKGGNCFGLSETYRVNIGRLLIASSFLNK